MLAVGPDGWAVPSNYPELSDGQILRLDWFILFFQFVTVCVVAIVISLGAVPQVHCYYHHLVTSCIPGPRVQAPSDCLQDFMQTA